MSESAVARANEVLNKTYNWHPKFNVYALANKDVLLLSESQQILFSFNEYPWVNLIDGKRNLQSIIALNKNSFFQGALLIQQYEGFLKSNLIVERAGAPLYLSPDFTSRMTEKAHWIQLSPWCYLANLSKSSRFGLDRLETCLQEVFTDYEENCGGSAVYQVVLVDDFIDPRIQALNFTHDFIIIKLSGENVWLSPLYKASEVNKVHALLTQVIKNQPVRNYLKQALPDQSHGFSFLEGEIMEGIGFKYLQKLLLSQLNRLDSKRLIIYNKEAHSVEYHQAKLEPIDKSKFAKQLEYPVHLNTCISNFSQDGGSRSIAPNITLEKLENLISPITGLINHLEVVNSEQGGSVKIYRSGFFKTPFKTEDITLNQESFVQLCMGKGVSDEQSKVSALCEALERYSAVYQGDVPLFKRSQTQLTLENKRSLNYQAAQSFSRKQYQEFAKDFQFGSGIKQPVKPYEDNEIHWLPIWSLSQQERVYAPLSLCFSNVPFNDNEFGRWHSNGCAAGNTLEEAVFQGLLELIERDAAAIWWYNRSIRPKFDLSRLDQSNLEKIDATLNPSKDKGHDYWVIDLTHDIGVPVMVAMGKDKMSGGWIMGFGCHLIAKLAAQRALTELCQLIPIREQNSAPFDFDEIEDHAYLYGDSSSKVIHNLLPCSKDIQHNIQMIVDRLDELGFETLVLNYSRSHIPVNTAKVFVPGLCHIWPQLGNERLYALPVSLSWVRECNTENTINQQGLYI